MTPDQAEALAARTLAAMPDHSRVGPRCDEPRCSWCADRERVASDLAGLRIVDTALPPMRPALGQCRALFVEGLRRTARLYGVTL